MCGICGEITFNGTAASASRLERICDNMAARGPDGAGLIVRGRVGFGHRRLKVIDPSEASAQPMEDRRNGLALVFNGCIYNYRQLRGELESLGHDFATAGDTEVVLKAWAQWGIEAVARLQGMFAFALHETGNGRVHLVRDRFGIKPLYLAEAEGRLLFASTLPALLAGGADPGGIDRVALHHYMTWHAVVPAPRTILNGIRKLAPATIRTIEPDGTHVDRRFWQLQYGIREEDGALSHEDWADRVEEAIRAAVRRRMVADVPTGVLLSGGLDSSLIVALLAEAGQQPLSTFSIGFEAANGEKGDEFIYSDMIAAHFGTDHHRYLVSHGELLANLPAAVRAMSEPMVSYDNIGFYLLAREVSRSVHVAQSGQGADEVFAGYHWYRALSGSQDPVGDYAAAFFDRTHATLKEQLSADFMIGQDESRAFVETHFGQPGANDPVDKALRLDTTVMLVDDPVKRVDNMTMAWGLEARVPFLDHELVELAARIPARYKLADGGKGVLKTVGRRMLPNAVIDRPKGYFPVPALKYIEGPFLELVMDALSSKAARERGLFKQSYLDLLLADPTGHLTPLRGSQLWQVALLEMWLQEQGIEG